MNLRPILLVFLFPLPLILAESDPFADPHDTVTAALEEKLFRQIEAAHAEYRKDFSEILKKSDLVKIHIVAFDRVSEKNHVKRGEEIIRIAPYNRYTPVLQTRVLDNQERKLVINAIAGQISKERHEGGALCHEPVHGIRVYKSGRIIFESTFCWVCGNFGFEYPAAVSTDKSEWLDTTPELAEMFAKLLPLPKAELDRFYKAHPGLKPEE